MAACEVIVREAGGRFTGLDGVPGPLGRNALATNGRLHDAALAFLGHFPDDADPDPDPASNVRDLAARRRPRKDS
jgi:histidinol-phosphatase